MVKKQKYMNECDVLLIRRLITDGKRERWNIMEDDKIEINYQT